MHKTSVYLDDKQVDAADPGAISDEVLGEFVAAILGCSIAVGEHG